MNCIYVFIVQRTDLNCSVICELRWYYLDWMCVDNSLPFCALKMDLLLEKMKWNRVMRVQLMPLGMLSEGGLMEGQL